MTTVRLNRGTLFAFLLVGLAARCGSDDTGAPSGSTGGGGTGGAVATGGTGGAAGVGTGGVAGSSGTGGVIGSGGAGGVAGSSGTGGVAGGGGTGGVAGSGGTGGVAGAGGAGGKAGAGGTAGASGTAGAGGTGGTTDAGGKGGTGGTIDAGGKGGAGGTTDAGGTDGGGTQVECKNPVFTTSDTNGGWSNGGYYVHNNMWNSAYGLGPETLYACAYNNWYVVSNQTNNAGAVKTYPNVHKDYNNVALSSFTTITSTFAETSPHVGIYNVAYDIWINGIATPGCTEIMIWNENFNQVPAGSKAATQAFGGRTYDVWKTSSNGYIAFVPTAVFTSGTIDLLEIFNWTISKGWLPANSTLGQICFGVEIVSTNGADATFKFTDFSITSN